MTHKRQAIRTAIVAALGTMPALTGRTFATRARPTEASELPVALVYTLNEESDLANAGYDLTRNLNAVVEVRAAAAANLDDALDALCADVETAINTDPRLGGLATLAFLTGTSIGLDGEGDGRQAVATLTYRVRYETTPAGL